MGKQLRKGEPAALESMFAELDIPILGRIDGAGRLEAGDILWLDERTVAVGQGPRSNHEGVEQLRRLLADQVDEVIPVPLPAGAFHLLGLVSLLDRDLAAASPRLPALVRDELLERGMTIVHVPEDEHRTLGCNILALGPRECVMVAGSSKTARRLEELGASIWQYQGNEISLKGCGGPTCLTRPLLRGRSPISAR
jgi:N-dimethylarginine dimethylaminohydrolase